MASPEASPTRHGSRKRGRIACKQCRLSKIRCGVEEVPCQRCDKLGLSCTVDSNYRRVNKQGKIEELEGHLQRLEKLVRNQNPPLNIPQASSPFSSRTYSGGTTFSEFDRSGNAYPSVNQHTQSRRSCEPTFPKASESQTAADRSIGHVKLGYAQIQSMFKIFFAKYHHFLPFLDPSRSAEEYYDASELLFWSIIAVAARQYRADNDLLTKLAPVLGDLVWTVIASNLVALAHIQALLLLSCWPLPNVHLWTDNSFILNNIALTSAMHLGLHRPGREEEYSKKKVILNQASVLERTRTWIACMVLSQSLSVDFGHASLVSFTDWTTTQACNGGSMMEMPAELRHNLLIQRCSNDTFRRLSQNINHPFGLPLDAEFYPVMRGLEDDFDALQEVLGGDISFANTLRLYTARLYLQCVYFLDENPDTYQQTGVWKAYSTACSLITTVISHAKSHELLSHAPLATMRSMLCAALVIFRMAHSAYGSQLDRSSATVLYNAAAFSMRQLSVQYDEKDIPIRAAEMLCTLWQMATNDLDLQSRQPTLRVKSRMGSSLVYDCLIILRNYTAKRSMDSSSQAPALQSVNADASFLTTPATNAPMMSGDLIHDPAQSTRQRDIPDCNQNWELLNLRWMENFGYPGLFDLQ